MLKTLENEISKHAAPPALQAEFAQHDFEKLRTFCRLTYISSIVIWLLFDLIVSFKGLQGFTALSMLFFRHHGGLDHRARVYPQGPSLRRS